MARNYGCRVTSVTLSVEQQKLATERIAEAGLSHRVEVVLQDYRTITGKFDKIVSIEMLEAVGHRYLKSYFRKCTELLEKEGILAVQVIVCPDSRYDSLRKGVDWIQKHIFPGSLLPSVGAINEAVNAAGDLTMIDLKELGLHYARTLRLWLAEFQANLPRVQALGFDSIFTRKWVYLPLLLRSCVPDAQHQCYPGRLQPPEQQADLIRQNPSHKYTTGSKMAFLFNI